MRGKKLNLLMVISIVVIALAITGFTVAQTNQTLEEELNNLITDLDNSGYGWLVDYSGDDLYSSVEVYEQDSSELLMTFDNIGEDKEYKKFLTNLNGSNDVFDLLVKNGNIWFDYIVDPVEINQSLETGLVLLMHFNNDSDFSENDTLVYDFSGNGNNGTWYGNDSSDAFRSGVNNTDGIINGSFTFDGDGDYVDLGDPDSMQVNQTWTLTAWIKGTSGSGYEHILDKGGWNAGEIALVIDDLTDHNLLLLTPDLTIETHKGTINVGDNVWHHVAATFNGSRTTIYVDGTEDNYEDKTGSIADDGDNWYLGSRLGTSNYFNGSIDEVAIWNRSLSADEVWHLYNRGTTNSTGECMNITSAGVYYLYNDIADASNTCMNISTSNVTLDCLGNTIDGLNTGDGILAQSDSGNEFTNITIMNCKVNDFNNGISFNYVDSSLIENTSVNSATDFGITITQSDYNKFINVTATNQSLTNTDSGIRYDTVSGNNNFTGGVLRGNSVGFIMDGGGDNSLVTGFNITNNTIGIKSVNALTDNNIIYNNFFNNTLNLDIIAGSDNYFNSTKTRGVNILGKDQYIWGNYWASPSNTNYSEICTDADYDGICDVGMNVSNGSLSTDVGYNIDSGPLTMVNKTGVLGCTTITSAGEYILTNSTIVDYPTTCISITASDVTLDCQGYTIDGVNTGDGILAQGGDGTELTNVTIKNCKVNDFKYGIEFIYVDNSLIVNSSANSPTRVGVRLIFSDYNNVNNVSVSNMAANFNYAAGYATQQAYYNNISGGSITGNYRGTYLYIASNLIISGVNIENNSIGISESTNNYFYNNFFNNTKNVDGSTVTDNYFNTTKTAGENIMNGSFIWGNYWAFPNGTGPSETCFDVSNEGICDTPIDVSSQTLCPGCTGFNIDEGALYGNEFISSWNISKVAGDFNVSLPLQSGGDYNFTVKWGDGKVNVITAYDDSNVTHFYPTNGTYTIRIGGNLTGWRFNAGGDKLKLIEISRWGDLRLGNSNGYFYGTSNLNITANDVLNTSGITDMDAAFRSSGISTVPNMGDWDMSSVITMNRVFQVSQAFDSNISNWDTSGVTSMSWMFEGASTFNQEIGNWNVSSVEMMRAMFNDADAFNQDIGSWNTSQVTTMQDMFNDAHAFNGNISGWDTSNVTNMNAMFYNAYSFNQSLSGWNTSKVTNMARMFRAASLFNGNISGWDTSSLTAVSQYGEGMFRYANAFNQDIGNWDVSGVSNFNEMFGSADIFNQDLSSWNTSKVTTMVGMFNGALAFNGNITNWDTSNVVTMVGMFNGATAFDQNLGSWNVTNVTNATDMFSSVTLSTANYDALLNGWASLGSLQNATVFDGGNSLFTPGAANDSRLILTDVWNWTITDGGESSDTLGECTNITSSGVYYLGNDISDYPATCMNISTSNVTLDCLGKTIDGVDTGDGILAQGGTGTELVNVTIKNCKVNDFEDGIQFSFVDSSLIENVTANSGSARGFVISNSENNRFNNITLTNQTGSNHAGILILNSAHSNNFTNGLIKGNFRGVWIEANSNNNIITGVNITNNLQAGIRFNTADSDNNLFYNNFFNNTLNVNINAGADNYFNSTKTRGVNILGKDQYIWGNYWASPSNTNYSEICTDADYDGICDTGMNVLNGSLSTDVGYNIDSGPLTMVNKTGVLGCANITSAGEYVLTNSTIVDYPATCINISSSDVTFDCLGLTIDGVDTGDGILAEGGDGTELTNVTIRNCNVNDFKDGILFNYVNNSLIENTSANSADDNGFEIIGSNYNQFNNLIATNQSQSASDAGIWLGGGTIRNNFTGGLSKGNKIGFTLGASDFIIIKGLNITDNSEVGMNIVGGGADNNIIYNNFFNNTLNIDIVAGADNYFNSSLQAGTNIIGKEGIWGNYWTDPLNSNYSDTCTDANGDGFCDVSMNVTDGVGLAGIGVNFDEGVLTLAGIALGSDICDTGDLSTTCNVTSLHVLNLTRVDANNVYINATGGWTNSSVMNFKLNLDGNLTIVSGGVLNFSGVPCNSGTCDSGGNITIVAEVVNISGGVLSVGGASSGGANMYSGDGGIITINATEIIINSEGTISASSDDIRNAVNDYGGGDGGMIIINTSILNNSGTIKAVGGNADSNQCTPSQTKGVRGNGGTINITTTIISNTGLINVERGKIGYCDIVRATNGLNGYIYVNNQFSPCNKGSILNKVTCQITKGIRVPNGEVIDFSGFNWTLGAGASLTSNGEICISGSCTSGNNFTIIVDTLNLAGGNITSIGGSTGTGYSGAGGVITINATEIIVGSGSVISASSDDIVVSSIDYDGGDGGTIIINTTILNNSGTIKAVGGNADSNSCQPSQTKGGRGKGGNITINAVTVYSNIITANRGNIGFCGDGVGGTVNIISTSYLNVTNISVIGNHSGTINLISDNLLVDGLLNATRGNTTFGVNGTINLIYDSSLNLTDATIAPFPFISINNTFGRLDFLTSISAYSTIDFSQAVFSSNNASVDIVDEANLNVPANITFYNVGADNESDVPIFRDGSVCSSDICSIVAFDNTANTLTFNVTGFSDYSIGNNNVTSCMNITTPGVYVLENSTIVDYPATCMNISVSDVTLDCQGYTIDGDDGSNTEYAIDARSLTNLTVKNCILKDFGAELYLNDVNDSLFENITTTSTRGSDGDGGYGFRFTQFYRNRFNDLNSTDDSYGGIYFLSGDDNNFTNIYITGGSKTKVYVRGTSNRFVNGTIITDGTEGTEAAITISRTQENVITGFNIIGAGNGIYFSSGSGQNAKNNYIYNNFFNNTLSNVIFNDATLNTNYFNTTPTAGTNIIGGSTIHGNFWTDPLNSNFSITCADANQDGICDSNYNVINQNTTLAVGYNVDEGALTTNSLLIVSEICDYGDLTTTCNVTTSHTITGNSFVLSANNVYINASGALTNSSIISFKMNLSGNLTIVSGGVLNFSGVPCASGTCDAGGNITIVSLGIVNVSGEIRVDGGATTGNAVSHYSGQGGVITINATEIIVNGGTISASSDDLRDSALNHIGGSGGTININTTVLNNSGTIKAAGGTGDSGTCASNNGLRGNGGNINITTVSITNNGLINVEKGPIGYCDVGQNNEGRDGLIYINDTFSPCNNGTIFDKANCQITKGIRVPNGEVIDFSGFNWTIEGRLNADGDLCTSGVCQSGENFTLVVDVLNLTNGGNISSDGGMTTGNAASHYSGQGGVIIINATEIIVDSGSWISASSDDLRNAISQFSGGNGGTIIINTTILNNSGTIKLAGGNGRYSSCTATQGTRGDGGNINITAQTVFSNIITSDAGSIGLCDDGVGGTINIISTNSLNVTNISVIGNHSGTINLISDNLLVDGLLNATRGNTTFGVNGTINLIYDSSLNLSDATITPFPFISINNTFGRLDFLTSISAYSSIDFITNVSLTENYIFVDGGSNSQALNMTSNITLRGLSTVFTNPVIRRDGVECVDCYNFTSLLAGNVTFNVTGFTNYTISSNDTTFPTITLVSPGNGSGYRTPQINVSSSEEGTGFIVPNLDNSLVSWWRMDDLNGSFDPVDYMGVNNGSAKGGASQVAGGKFGAGFEFDGEDDEITIPTDASLNFNDISFTFGGWFKTNDITVEGRPLGKVQPGSEIYEIIFGNSASKISFYLSDSEGDLTGFVHSTNNFNSDTWYNVFVSVDQVGETAKLYVNGNEEGSADISALEDISPTGDLIIGWAFVYFNGTIDEVMIFNRSLSADEIVALFNATRIDHTETTLTDGNHTFKAYTSDLTANVVSTTLITFAVDTAIPTINFSFPTPASATIQSPTAVFVNVTTSDNDEHSAFIDWDRSLVLWMNFDDRNASGDPYDNSTWGNNGSAKGGASYTVNGKRGGAFEFDGDGDYIQHGSNIVSHNDNFTLSAWINFVGPSSSAFVGIVSEEISAISKKWGLKINGSGFIQYTQYDNTVGAGRTTDSSVVNLNQWHHIVVRRNDSTVIVYVDGVSKTLDNSGSTDGGFGTPTLRVGRYRDTYFNGSIDEVLIFNRALSPAEINAIYNAGTYKLFNNFTDLAGGDYTYKAHVIDIAGNTNVTELRTITIDTSHNISIIIQTDANTSEVVNVQGLIKTIDDVPLDNGKISMTLNNVIVSSDTFNDSAFVNGDGTAVNFSNVVQLNFSGAGVNMNYNDDFSTTKYTTDSHNYSSPGYSDSGHVFEGDFMTLNVGNITYQYLSPSNFFNATVVISTLSSSDGTTGNSSILYSYDNATWVSINSTTSKGDTLTSSIPVDGYNEFYIMLRSDTDGLSSENPIGSYDINYTQYQYETYGEFNSSTIFLPNVTYTTLKWDQNTTSGGAISLQLRQSANGTTWESWTGNYTSNLDNSITNNITKNYIQYRALFTSTEVNVTPTLHSVNISFFNVTTNSTGGYNVNITIPTDSLGVLPFNVSISPAQGTIGNNQTNITVWAVMSVPYTVSRNYTQSFANYSVFTNFTRVDIGELVNGTFEVNISNSSTSSTQTCSTVTNCTASWLVPSELGYGNYTINISAYNETGYYRNISIGYVDFLEAKNTTGSLQVINVTISDFTVGTDYSFVWNASVENTGNASMNDISVYDVIAARGAGIKNITLTDTCSRNYPTNTCNVSMLIELYGTSNVGEANAHFISWRANWSDNDGGLASFIADTDMYVTILGNSSISITNSSVNLTIEHGAVQAFTFDIDSVGSTTVLGVNITFLAEGLNITYVNITPSTVGPILAGSDETIIVNVSMPLQTSPGNYSGILNVSTSNAEERYLNLTIEVPENRSWTFVPANLSYNTSFELNTAGQIGNITINNTGNIDTAFSISYASWGNILYTDFGLTIFEENQVVDSVGMNPTLINVTKGNTTPIQLYQKGRSSPLTQIGVALTISNASTLPTVDYTSVTFNLEEAVPQVSDIIFFVDGEQVTIVEVNKNVTIKVVGTDDVDLNATLAIVNITLPNTTMITFNASNNSEFVLNSLEYIAVNYTLDYPVQTAGRHNVTARVYDNNGGTNLSAIFNFSADGITFFNLVQNSTSLTAQDINIDNKQIHYINYTVNNSGNITAYDVNLSFILNETISYSPISYYFGNLSKGVNTSNVFQFNFSSLLLPGTYTIEGKLNFTNADNTLGSSNITFTLTVLANNSMAFDRTEYNLTVGSGLSNVTNVIINNTGNTALNNLTLSCVTGNLCGNFTVTFNSTSFNISNNGSQTILMNLTASSGLAAGFYSGQVNVSEANESISKTFNVVSTVPDTLSWNVVPSSIATSKAAGGSGTIQTLNISNTGNVDIVFNITSTNNSLVFPNMSSIEVAFGTTGRIMLNYSSPSADGLYNVNISITNASANPTQINVTVNLTSTNLNATVIFPLPSNQLTNVISGALIEILTNASFENVILTADSTWAISIGGSSCTNVVSTYKSSGGRWNVTCTAPTLLNGVSYDLIATLTHDIYGEASETSASSVSYLDTSPPGFTTITRNNIAVGARFNISVNVTDNVNVSVVSVSVTYPNGTIFNANLSLIGGLYNLTGPTLSDFGEYVVNFTANDTLNNLNSTLDWFEVLDQYTTTNVLVDHENVGLSGVNITLLRPNTNTALLANLSNASGGYSLYVNKRFYDIRAILSGDNVRVINVNFTNDSTFRFNVDRFAVDELSEVVPLHKVFDGISSNSTGLSSNDVTLTFNYSGLSYDNVADLEVVKCGDWDFQGRECTGSWTAVTSSIDRDNTLVQGNSTGFSAYFLSEDKCGNGLCETNYAETTSTCSADCTTTTITSSSGGGGGGGGFSSADLKDIEKLIKSFLNVGGVNIETTSIYKELFAGDSTTFRIRLSNTLNSVNTITLSATGEPAGFISFESSSVELQPNENRDILVTIVVPRFTEPANYDGDLVLASGEEEASIPLTVRVLSPEGKLLDVKIQPLKNRVEPGETLRLQLDLLNLGKTKRVDVQFDLQLIDAETGEIITRKEEAFAVETTTSTIKELKIPDSTPLGNYLIKGVASYSSLEETNQQASSIAHITVDYVFYKKKILFIPVWMYLIILLAIAFVIGGGYYVKYLNMKKRRFRTKVEFNKLPHAGKSSAFIGKVAESGVRAFTDLNKLQMHTLVAGATGSGKTIAAQDIVEAALLHNKAVIIFDPTAQWTGFLRATKDKKMLKRYKFFDMKSKEAKGFNGVIKTIRDPYELIDIGKYLKRKGEITIFNVSHLTPKEIDIVVASTIEQVFKSEPEESADLKSLIVYDEVHRLLPKFGGSGRGFIQLERGAREFRKWGIGLVLISQVLTDFVGEVKANIGTEIQMGTRYEGDLERVGVKYGDDILKSLVKEPIGTGMVVNAEYNLGRPYFVAFRPLLHETKRLSKEELKKYEDSFVEIEDLEYQAMALKKKGVDILDLQLELKLASSKVREGQFQMSEMYLDSLRPRFVEAWSKLGLKPEHIVVKKISKEEVIKGISEAKKARAKYIKSNPEKEVSFNEEIAEFKKVVEAKKKSGVKTTEIESKIKDLENRLKPFKGKISSKDAKGVKWEIDSIKNEVEKLDKNEVKKVKK